MSNLKRVLRQISNDRSILLSFKESFLRAIGDLMVQMSNFQEKSVTENRHKVVVVVVKGVMR